MKKIKKIILVVIVSLIALISVFSCFKGKYTPEPILTPVSVLKPANSSDNNVVNPTGNYEYIYVNLSLSNEYINNLLSNFDYTLEINGQAVGQSSTKTLYFYPILYYQSSNSGLFAHKVIDSANAANDLVSLETFDLNTFVVKKSFYLSDLSTNDFGWRISNGVLPTDNVVGNSSIEFMGNSFPVGDKNNLLTNLISSTPFLFEGTSNSIAWTSSGLDNPNNIQSIYFNTNLTNQAIKNILDTYIGDTAGVDIFYYLDDGVRVRCHVINNSANAFIQIIGGSTTLYKWIYDSIDTDESIWWYGIDPAIIDNGNVIISPRGNSLNGFNIYELRSLFSSANDFIETPSGDSYEQGYRDGYTAGETSGYNQGYTAGETAGYNQGYTAGETAGYNQGYTAGESAGQTAGYNQGYTAGETAGYNQGYLAGLDDGAGSNVNFQYIESVLNLIGNFLNIEILPNIKLSYALGIIIILSIISIIKMVVK